MIINYSKKKSVAVIELSSSGVKSISACPLHTRKRDDLSKFSDNHKAIYNISQLIDDNNVIDESKFELEVLPLIIKLYRNIKNSRNPQAFKIIATGYYRMAENSNNIVNIVEDAISAQSGSNNFSIEVLSIFNESYLSFISWYSTNKSLSKANDFKENYFKTNSIVLNIDCGGSTTEISFLKNINDFSNTLSLLTQVTKVSNRLANNSKFSSKVFDSSISKLIAYALDVITENYTRIYTISLCVITGSNISSFCNSVFEQVQDTIQTDSLRFPLIQVKAKLENNFKTYSIQEREEMFKQILSISVIKSVLGFLKIDSFNLNNANLRIGCYYDMLTRLRENRSPYN